MVTSITRMTGLCQPCLNLVVWWVEFEVRVEANRERIEVTPVERLHGQLYGSPHERLAQARPWPQPAEGSSARTDQSRKAHSKMLLERPARWLHGPGVASGPPRPPVPTSPGQYRVSNGSRRGKTHYLPRDGTLSRPQAETPGAHAALPTEANAIKQLLETRALQERLGFWWPGAPRGQGRVRIRPGGQVPPPASSARSGRRSTPFGRLQVQLIQLTRGGVGGKLMGGPGARPAPSRAQEWAGPRNAVTMDPGRRRCRRGRLEGRDLLVPRLVSQPDGHVLRPRSRPRGERRWKRPRLAYAEESARLWSWLVALNPPDEEYQKLHEPGVPGGCARARRLR